MEPIGSTYGSSAPTTFSESSLLRHDTDQRTNVKSANGEAPSASPQKHQDSARNRQLGIQLSSDSSREEFQAYSPENQKRAEKPATTPPQAANKDAPATLPGDKKQEDPQVQQQVAQLKAIEQKVKAHEAAHKAAGGALTGPISYSYTRGPDGRSYVTGGEVQISVSPGKTPQETASRMQQVIQAALAPADPSPQDRAVAAQAVQQLQKAQQQRNNSTLSGNGDTTNSTDNSAEAKDSGQVPEKSSNSTITDTTVAGEGWKNPETSANNLTAQAAKAYSDPSVTGENYTSREVTQPVRVQTAADPITSGLSHQDGHQAAPFLSPSMITGLDPQPLVSHYA